MKRDAVPAIHLHLLRLRVERGLEFTPITPSPRPARLLLNALEADRRELHEARTRTPFELPHYVAKKTTVRSKRCNCIESEVAEPVV